MSEMELKFLAKVKFTFLICYPEVLERKLQLQQFFSQPVARTGCFSVCLMQYLRSRGPSANTEARGDTAGIRNCSSDREQAAEEAARSPTHIFFSSVVNREQQN